MVGELRESVKLRAGEVDKRLRAGYHRVEVAIVALVAHYHELNQPMHTHNYALEVLVNGRPVQEFYKDQRSFIEARSGTEYTLRFRNNSWKRVLAIFSVDGIEVLKGKAAAQADNGYVVDAFSTIEVKGYRIDDKTVAAFKFSGGQQSYSVVVGAETKDPVTGEVKQDKSDRNNGVIGVRVFEEDVADHNYAEAFKKLPTTTFHGGAGSSRVVYNTLGATAFNCSLSGGYNLPFRDYSEQDVLSFSSRDFTGCAGSLAVGNGTITTASVSLSNSANSVTFTASMGRQDVNQFGKLERFDSGGLVGASCCSSSSDNVQATLSQGSFVMARSLAPDFDLGTAWGAKVDDKVREVKFKKVATSVDIAIYYASRQSLESWGIDFSNTKQVFAWPSAFEDKKQYCKLPPGYKV